MRITKIDRQACDTIRETLNKLLAKTDLEGVHFEVGKMSYCEDNVKIQLTASIQTEEGDIKTPESIMYEQYAGSMGLPPNGLGMKFAYGDQIYALSGLSTRRCKNCVHAKRLSDGVTVRLTVDLAQQLLKFGDNKAGGKFVMDVDENDNFIINPI